MSLTRRILSGTMANTAGIAMNAMLQLVSVPVLVSAWGAEAFGLWIMLTTIPTYFALTDLGFLQATTSEMAMLIARGERTRAARVFISSTALIAAVSAGIFLLVTVIALGCAILDVLPGGVGLPVLLLLAGFSVLSLLSRLPVAALRASGHYARGTIAYDTMSTIEGIAGLAVAAAGGGFGDVALSFLLIRVVTIALLFGVLYRLAGWLRPNAWQPVGTDPGGAGPISRRSRQHGARAAVASPAIGPIGDRGQGLVFSASALAEMIDFDEIRALFRPALAALTIPLALALNLQGVVLIIGAVLSPAAVAVYSPVRTCSRLLIQLVGTVNRATMPELSSARAGERSNDLRRILKVNGLLLLFVLLPGTLIFAAIGRDFVALWSGGHILPDRTFVAAVALATLVHGSWYFLSNMLLATNDHIALARYSLGCALLTLGLVALLANVAGLSGVGLALLVGECLCAIAVGLIFVSHYRQVLRWI